VVSVKPWLLYSHINMPQLKFNRRLGEYKRRYGLWGQEKYFGTVGRQTTITRVVKLVAISNKWLPQHVKDLLKALFCDLSTSTVTTSIPVHAMKA
jgi:hypothetical protein